jgi:tetratricopeptide (TPR) repeat protein
MNVKLEKMSPEKISNRYLEEGLKQMNQKDYDKALVFFDLAVKENPENIEALNNRANLLVLNRKFKEALCDYEQILKKKPNNYKAFFNMAILFGQTGDYEKSIEYANKVLSIKSDFYEVFRLLSSVYYAKGDYCKSIEYANIMIEKQPQNKVTHIYRGLSYIEMNELEKAKKDFDYVLKFEPNVYQAYYGLSKYYEKKKDIKKALENCEKASNLIKNDPLNKYFDPKDINEVKNNLKELKVKMVKSKAHKVTK